MNKFLKNGELGSLKIKSSRSHVLENFGTPKQWGGSKDFQSAELWKYNDIEISFIRDMISLIGLYYSEKPLHFPNNIAIKNKTQVSSFNLVNFESYLIQQKLEYVTNHSLTFDDQICLKVANFSNVLFRKSTKDILSIQCALYSS